MEQEKTYIAIDLKSFYASVECVERGLDPLKTNLVVADASRTDKTICLAVSPSLKQYGLSGRSRLFEVVQEIERQNKYRRRKIKGYEFAGSSYDDDELKANEKLAINYLIAPPRMAYYIEYSARIYDIYLKYIAPEDIHVYSIDEVFIDASSYLKTYKMDGHQLARKLISEVLQETGITATAGIGTNLYLCKVAMDIVAKHIPADKDGVRIAELDEMSYRQQLWTHQPLTDFWRVGKGIQKRLNDVGIYTMGDIARCSIGEEKAYYNEDLLYKMFGVNAELLIDHAWGVEPVTISDIKAYKPDSNSISSGQVLSKPYNYQSAKLIVKEMVNELVLDLVEKEAVTDSIVLTIGYDAESLNEDSEYEGELATDFYGRQVPKHGHGTVSFDQHTNSQTIIMPKVVELYDKISNKSLLVRRVTIAACNLKKESETDNGRFYQLDIFSDFSRVQESEEKRDEVLDRERKVQQAILEVKKSFGKNAAIKGMDLQEDATTIERNGQIGGHRK